MLFKTFKTNEIFSKWRISSDNRSMWVVDGDNCYSIKCKDLHSIHSSVRFSTAVFSLCEEDMKGTHYDEFVNVDGTIVYAGERSYNYWRFANAGVAKKLAKPANKERTFKTRDYYYQSCYQCNPARHELSGSDDYFCIDDREMIQLMKIDEVEYITFELKPENAKGAHYVHKGHEGVRARNIWTLKR